MPETKRQRIVDEVVTQLESILTTNGFLTNIGNSVHEWREVPFEEAELPALVFRDLDEPQELSNLRGKRVVRQLHCLVQIITSGNTPMRDVRKILADVERAVGIGAETSWDNLASETKPRISRAVLDQESLKFAGSTFEWFIHYPTTAFDSFN